MARGQKSLATPGLWYAASHQTLRTTALKFLKISLYLFLDRFVVSCFSRAEKRVQIFSYNSSENVKSLISNFPSNCKCLKEMRIHENKLLATFDKSVVILWDLDSNRILKMVNFGQMCKRVTTGLSGFDILTFNRKGYSRTMTKLNFNYDG